MKKILIVSLFFLLLIGCSKRDNNKEIYEKYYEILDSINSSSEYIPLDIEIQMEKLTEEEYVYAVSLGNPKEELKNIETIVIHNYETKDIFPSSGLIDEKLSLIPNVIDEENNIVKGILLIGYIDTENIDEIEFKVMIKSDNKKYYYIETIDSL